MENLPSAIKRNYRPVPQGRAPARSTRSANLRKVKQLACNLTTVFLVAMTCYGKEGPIQALPATFKAENGNEFTLALKEQIEPKEDAVGLVADTKENKLYMIVDAGRTEAIELLLELSGKPAEGWRISPADAPDDPILEVTVRLEPKEDLTEPPELKFPFREKFRDLPEVLTDNYGNTLYIREADPGNTAISHQTPMGESEGKIMVDLPEAEDKESDKNEDSPFPITFELTLDGQAASDWEEEEDNPKNISVTIEADRMIKPEKASMTFTKEDQGSGGQHNPSGEDEDSDLTSKIEESPPPEPLIVEIVVVPVALAVDANRDGHIRFSGVDDNNDFPADVTTEEKPFRFWINDDNDGLPNSEGEFVGTKFKDFEDGVIQTARDLEDFSRLWLHVGGLDKEISDGNIKIGVKWRKNKAPPPRIKVYKSSDLTGSDSYLKSEQGAFKQITGDDSITLGEASGRSPLLLDRKALSNNSRQKPTRLHLLFEGSGEGKGALAITIHKSDGSLLAECGRVWIELLNVRKMYQSSTNKAFLGGPPDEAQQTLVFVHGWSMSPEGSASFADTMYKRLWHRGFKGRFAYFRWNTHWSTNWQWLPIGGGAIDAYLSKYNHSEYIAWTEAAPALKAFVQKLPYSHKVIAAHSMGNIVASEALRLGMRVNIYALMQAAVPAAAYDEDEERIRQTSPYRHTIFPLTFRMWDSPTPDEDEDPFTRKLAYRGTFRNIGNNARLINFYLPEDYATSFAWEINNDQTKPPIYNGDNGNAFLCFNFEYDPEAAPGKKIMKFIISSLNPSYYLDNKHEAMAYACRTYGKAAGAFGPTAGAIHATASVNLGSSRFQLPDQSKSGFGEEHSGQFNANIQSLKRFYDELIDSMEIGPTNP